MADNAEASQEDSKMESTETETETNTTTAPSTTEEPIVEKKAPPHPHQEQLTAFTPRDWQLEEKEPEMHTTLEECPYTWVDTPVLLEEMMSKLRLVKEIAVDLSHHKYRSFQGITCVVEISTRQEDFLVDAIALKNDLKVLNEVFTDAEILKVIHGSERDMEGLQKDLGVFMINLFDAKQAEVGSIGNMLKKHCNVEMNKDLLGVDWRDRPLTEDMVKFARTNTHYLLYIYDVLRNSLLKKTPDKKSLLEVYTASTRLCSYVWYPEKYDLTPESHLTCYRRIKGKLNVQQMECFRLLFEWRYNISREKDESTGYAFPNKLLVKVSKALPENSEEVEKICEPLPELVKEGMDDILELIRQAIKNVPEVPDNNKSKEVPKASKKKSNKPNKSKPKRDSRGGGGGHRGGRGGQSYGKRSLMDWGGGHGGPRPRMIGGFGPMSGPGWRPHPYERPPFGGPFGGFGPYGQPPPARHFMGGYHPNMYNNMW